MVLRQQQDQPQDYSITLRTAHLEFMKILAKETDIIRHGHLGIMQNNTAFTTVLPNSETNAGTHIGSELTSTIS